MAASEHGKLVGRGRVSVTEDSVSQLSTRNAVPCCFVTSLKGWGLSSTLVPTCGPVVLGQPQERGLSVLQMRGEGRRGEKRLWGVQGIHAAGLAPAVRSPGTLCPAYSVPSLEEKGVLGF